MATGMSPIRNRTRIGRRGIIITTLTHTTTRCTIIPISFSRSLFRLTIHMTGMTMIILIVFAIIIGIITVVTVIREGSLVSFKSYSKQQG